MKIKENEIELVSKCFINGYTSTIIRYINRKEFSIDDIKSLISISVSFIIDKSYIDSSNNNIINNTIKSVSELYNIEKEKYE